MSDLRVSIAAHGSMEEELPLVHSTRGGFFDGIIAANAISPTACPVFHENLIYMFYGRPAYRSTRGGNAGDPVALCPICFVFKPKIVAAALSKVYPLDTGAASADKFLPHISNSDLPDLELEPNIESARRAVSLFFETNTNYFYGRAVTSFSGTAAGLTRRFHQLLIHSGMVPYDDRRSAIEVSFQNEVSLRDTLLFVVLPQEYLDDLTIRRVILEEWNCDPCPYKTVQGTSPTEYYPIIRQRIEDYLTRTTRI